MAVTTGDLITAAMWNAIGDSVPTGQGDTVATNESTTSLTFTDLATVGPSVTVTIPTSGRAFVQVVAHMQNDSVAENHGAEMGWEGGGLAAHSGRAARVRSVSTRHESRTWGAVVDGLTPGEQTFTGKYARITDGTANFEHRFISVIPLPLPEAP